MLRLKTRTTTDKRSFTPAVRQKGERLAFIDGRRLLQAGDFAIPAQGA